MSFATLKTTSQKNFFDGKRADFSTASERAQNKPVALAPSIPSIGERSYNNLSRPLSSNNNPIRNLNVIGNTSAYSSSSRSVAPLLILPTKKKTQNKKVSSASSLVPRVSDLLSNYSSNDDDKQRLFIKLDRLKKQIEQSKEIFEREIEYFRSLISETPEEKTGISKAILFLENRSKDFDSSTRQVLLNFEKRLQKVETNPLLAALQNLDLQGDIDIEFSKLSSLETVASKQFEEDNFESFKRFFFHPLDLEVVQAKTIAIDLNLIIDKTRALVSNLENPNSIELDSLSKQLKAKQDELSDFILSLTKPKFFAKNFIVDEKTLDRDLLLRFRSIATDLENFYGSNSNIQSFVSTFEKNPSDQSSKNALIKILNENNLPEDLISKVIALIRDFDKYVSLKKSDSIDFPSVSESKLQNELNIFRNLLKTGLDVPKDSSFFDVLAKDEKLSRDLDSLQENLRIDLLGYLSKIESKNERLYELEKQNKELLQKIESLKSTNPTVKSPIATFLREKADQSFVQVKGLESLIDRAQTLRTQPRQLRRTKSDVDILRNEIVELRSEADQSRRKLQTTLQTVQGLEQTKKVYRSLSGLSLQQNLQNETIDVETNKLAKLKKYLKKHLSAYKKLSKEIKEKKQAEIFDEPLLFKEFMQKTTEDGISLEDTVSRLFQTEEDVQDLGSIKNLPLESSQEDLETIVLLKNYLLLPIRIQWMVEIKTAIKNFVGNDLSSKDKLSPQQMKEVELAFQSFFEWLQDTSQPLKIIDIRDDISSNPKILDLAKRIQTTWIKYDGYKQQFTDYIVKNYREIKDRKENFDQVFEYLQKTIPLQGYFEGAKSFNVETSRDGVTFFGGNIFGTEGFEDAIIGFGDGNSIQDFEKLDQNFRQFFDKLFYRDFSVSQDLSAYF